MCEEVIAMHVTDIDALLQRDASHGVDPQFPRRWSPRAMSGEAIEDELLMRLFEAARWAPSSYNSQPWRFVYAKRETPSWDRFFDLLVEFNQGWCARAGVLVVICSRFEKNDKPAPTFALDAGAAWMSLALQGSTMGLVVHGMQGFDYEKAAEAVGAKDPFKVLAMCAIGKPGRVEDLPDDAREKETQISGRKELEEIVFEGSLPD
jgi:nitroreductase